MNKIFLKYILIGLVLSLFIFTAVYAQYGLQEAGSKSGLASNILSKSGDIPTILGYLVSTVLSLVGIFFFLMILYAGFIWMTASGSTERVESAKKKMTSAVIGLVIVLSAYALTNFVFTTFIQDVGTKCPEECEATQICVVDKCIDKCEHIYKDYGGKCINIVNEPCDGKIFSGLCKGKLSKKCCIPTAEYKKFESFIEKSTAESAGIVTTIPEKNACEKGGDMCVEKNACLNVYNGRDLGQNGCAKGDICCRACKTSTGGDCVKEQSSCVPADLALTGFCYGVFDGYFCCTGFSTQ